MGGGGEGELVGFSSAFLVGSALERGVCEEGGVGGGEWRGCGGSWVNDPELLEIRLKIMSVSGCFLFVLRALSLSLSLSVS